MVAISKQSTRKGAPTIVVAVLVLLVGFMTLSWRVVTWLLRPVRALQLVTEYVMSHIVVLWAAIRATAEQV